MPELDVLRGVAVLGVLWFHGFRAEYGELPFRGARRVFILATQPGALGVNLFFVLSGFLITGILLDSRNRSDYYRRFYTRRALRILPAYYALLLLLAILNQASAAFLGLTCIYLSNVVSLFGVSMDHHPLWFSGCRRALLHRLAVHRAQIGGSVSSAVFTSDLHPNSIRTRRRFSLWLLSGQGMVHLVYG